jgi:hypothetical protein
LLTAVNLTPGSILKMQWRHFPEGRPLAEIKREHGRILSAAASAHGWMLTAVNTRARGKASLDAAA